jgi:DNA repair protein RecO (recombination protein O)
MLHEGRGELKTVTGASTVDGYGDLRSDAARLGAAARACDAVLRLLDGEEPNRAAYNLLCTYLGLLDGPGGVAAAEPRGALAFRAKLALAAGFAPELAGCARCGETEHLSAFSGAAGGVVCSSCEGEGFPLSAEAHGFLVGALGSPLSDAPATGEAALRQAERALTETLEHHAHVHLRAAA